ncbi:hypothetical protein GCM10007108_02570 [Thermogymnomonas acidicola]|uniref:HTH bat-type domain-containing protein n=1 Tax=Thermogymnomonas acidicola TaxID=399579 RepID=A0AA37BQ30_9ARCH|nr:helix-turn-helix domain-containing protein [Thermogymnomonas acidicola]GGM68009.1 hypothetical protein GCM10007108_02570 [Thermogymnomonas acidicola]
MTRFVEALIEVKRSDCKVTNAVYSVSPGISVKRLRIGSERSLHIVSCRGHMDEVKEEACKIKGANVWSSGKDLLMVDAPSCSACRAVSGIDAAVTASKSVGQHHIVFRFLFRSNSHMKNVIKILADNGLEPRVVEVQKPMDLTEREKEILLEAYRQGYFEPDRRVSMTELARQMNISTPTLSEEMRRIMKKLVRNYIEESVPE